LASYCTKQTLNEFASCLSPAKQTPNESYAQLEARLSIMKVYSRGCEKLFPGKFQFASDDEFNYFLSHQLNTRLATKLNDRMEKMQHWDTRNGRDATVWTPDEIVRLCREIDDKDNRNKQLINEQNREAGMKVDEFLITSSYHVASLPRALQIVMGTLNNTTRCIDQEILVNHAITNIVPDPAASDPKKAELQTVQKLVETSSSIAEETMRDMQKKTEAFQKLIEEQTAKINKIEAEHLKKINDLKSAANNPQQRGGRGYNRNYQNRGYYQNATITTQNAPQEISQQQQVTYVPRYVPQFVTPQANNTMPQPSAQVAQPMINYAQQVPIPNAINNSANAVNETLNLIHRTNAVNQNFMAAVPNRPPSVCYNCDKPGHRARECTEIRRCANCHGKNHLVYNCTLPPQRPCRHCGKGDHFDFQCPQANDARNLINNQQIINGQQATQQPRRVAFAQPGTQSST